MQASCQDFGLSGFCTDLRKRRGTFLHWIAFCNTVKNVLKFDGFPDFLGYTSLFDFLGWDFTFGHVGNSSWWGPWTLEIPWDFRFQ
ncbi:hypothetical protein RCL_jg27943.t1 [Rhizophagus clarus]|uniref:Uncharacterized protein n=1 Tax=Rhizophagus clarus TaxID=94130 RepID=A0A8H3M303_9GLOM|nr:hypothetical protein RCL_jg27943.t1 [Rhizophagus clarus]